MRAKTWYAHPVTTCETVTSENIHADDKQYIGFAMHWDAAETGFGLPIALSINGEDEAIADELTPKEDIQIPCIASGLHNNHLS